MPPRDDRVDQEIAHLLDSAKRLRDELRTKEANYRRIAKLLDRGDDVRSVLNDLNAAAIRQDMSDALDAFEQSRHQVRVAIAARGMDEGMTIGEIARSWGVSRQLAARYAKEARSLA
jgi:hypothetical protein